MIHMRKSIAIGTGLSVMIFATFAFVFTISGASAANDYCGASANGCAHSQENTICAGHGAFGAFGKDNNFAGGASGERTAFNNSTLCGNPQGQAGILDPTAPSF
jgi:hypothetical protein